MQHQLAKRLSLWSYHALIPRFNWLIFRLWWAKTTYLQGLHQRSVWSTPQRARHFFSGFPEERRINIHNGDVCTLINPHGCRVIKTKTYLHFPELFPVFVFFSDDGSNYYAINYLNVWMRSSLSLERFHLKFLIIVISRNNIYFLGLGIIVSCRPSWVHLHVQLPLLPSLEQIQNETTHVTCVNINMYVGLY